VLGNHKLLCGDARCAADLASLMTGCRADMAFLNPPQAEFAMAGGDMSSPDFVRFLSRIFDAAASASRVGAVHFVCIDWRHIAKFMLAAEPIYGKMIDVVAWVKSKADPGSLYRSQHEFIGVFGVGKAPHPGIAPGRRTRSNVWHHAAFNGRLGEFHSPAKPVALVADAIKDCTRRGDVILDTFAGPGTTVMAAERVGRHARALEVEPRLVDVAVRRWQTFARADAVHAESGLSFDDVAAGRRLSAGASPHQSEM
jgi:DNA methylase